MFTKLSSKNAIHNTRGDKNYAAAALELRADQAEIRRQRLEAFHTQPIHRNEDEQNDSETPIMDVFMETGGGEVVLKMTDVSR